MKVEFQVHEYITPTGSALAYGLMFEVLTIPLRKGKAETGKYVTLRKCVDVIGHRERLHLLTRTSEQVKQWLDENCKYGYLIFKVAEDGVEVDVANSATYRNGPKDEQGRIQPR